MIQYCIIILVQKVFVVNFVLCASHERVITLVLWYQQRLIAMSPFTRNLWSKWSTALRNADFNQLSAHNVSTIRARKQVQLSPIEVDHALSSELYRWSDKVRTLPLTPPKGGSKSEFAVFVNKIQVQSNKVCYKVSFCENFQRQNCIVEPI